LSRSFELHLRVLLSRSSSPFSHHDRTPLEGERITVSCLTLMTKLMLHPSRNTLVDCMP
jgi:hypothetical protein